MPNPKIHIICGMCGDRTMMSIQVKEEMNDNTGLNTPTIYFFCSNCSTLTDIGELSEIKFEEKYGK